ncbi:hypothetical protein DL764_005389 [Monosporascus ibericus]|uniref:Manganese lipoxygenase n=1 Tax=Monosporascus ibericus TaxID=155417 RepID=A0A4Q4TCB9_9PEZI|nr:hypothetical protein DL764_005389 [Monosporascus ibericus]
MLALISGLLCAGVAVEAAAIPGAGSLDSRQTAAVFSLPQFATDGSARTAEIAMKQDGWQYGPSVAGDTAFYPTGVLGDIATGADVAAAFAFQDKHYANVLKDSAEVVAALNESGGVKSLDDFVKYYEGHWKLTVPEGPYDGMLTNYKDDLLFSMERLSVAPFRIFRIGREASLPFAVENAASISGLSLEDLHSQGRLFLVDHSDQKDLPRSAAYKYGGAAQAYFFIHPASNDFLPLAIKPNNEGSDLVFTPEDDENDWLLAKMIFNLNDIWFTQWYHLAATHVTSEIVYLSAVRSLSEQHPLMPILHRLSKWTWAMRPLAINRLILKGGPVDQLFPWAGSIAGEYTDGLYKSGEASAFQANYMRTNLERRGLINSRFGPPLKSFPFYEDASVVVNAIRDFFEAFVDSYYEGPDAVARDAELQAWLDEANGAAQVRDFPASPIAEPARVVDILTHYAYLVAVQHGVLNTNSPVASTASLPLHPLAFYRPLPTRKGTVSSGEDLVTYLPPPKAAIGQIALLAAFNRPMFAGGDETIAHMFDDSDALRRMNPTTRDAETKFRAAMDEFSAVVAARKFDADGLSQGMPFIWNALDPHRASYWLTI